MGESITSDDKTKKRQLPIQACYISYSLYSCLPLLQCST